jgi:hypothetical protein
MLDLSKVCAAMQAADDCATLLVADLDLDLWLHAEDDAAAAGHRMAPSRTGRKEYVSTSRTHPPKLWGGCKRGD